jgi:hypothetical protein
MQANEVCKMTKECISGTGVGQNNGNINMVFKHLLPSVQLQSLEWARTSFEQSLVEFYTILLDEHLQVALEMLEMGMYSSL